MICEQCKLDTITDENFVKYNTTICENCREENVKNVEFGDKKLKDYSKVELMEIIETFIKVKI